MIGPPRNRQKRGASQNELVGYAAVAQRQPARTRIRWRRIPRARIVQMLLVVLAGQALAALLSSPWFYVRDVRLSGVRGLCPEEVEAIRLASVVRPRTNLFRAPAAGLRAALLRIPCVSHAEVTRWPPSTLLVRVTQRAPAAVFATESGAWEVDSAGTVIRRARSKLPLPRIVMPSAGSLEPGQPAPLDFSAQLIGGARQLAAPPPTPVAKFLVANEEELCLNMNDGVVIRLGSVDELPAKLALIRRIYQEDPGIGAEVESIDLRSPDTPACTPRKHNPVERSGRRKRANPAAR